MRHKRILSGLLTVAVLLSCVLPAWAGTVISGVGSEVRHNLTTLHTGTLLHETTLLHNSAGRQEERFIEVGAQSPLTPVVSYGSTVYNGNLTMPQAAQALRDKGLEVVAGLNADFYYTANGIPCGLLITDGVVRASDNGQYAVGFMRGGGAFIGQPRISVSVNTVSQGNTISIPIKQINRVREDDGIYLYTPDFGATTRTVLEGMHVVLNTTGTLRVGSTIGATVSKLVYGKEAYTLLPGQMVLSCTSAGPIAQLQRLYEGMMIDIQLSSADTRWGSCDYAVGGQYKLLTNGAINAGLGAGTAPRTAVGTRQDGSMVFYTVDGRQSEYSVGLSLSDVAQRMASLGCTEALELDGGGSTIMGATYPGLSTMQVLGRPSDGTPRKSSNYIFLVNKTPKYDTIGKIFVYPNKVTMLQNATLQFNAAATDVNYHPVSLPAASWNVGNYYSGTVGVTGAFAAMGAGTVSVSASYGGTSGSAEVTVVNELDSILITNEKSQREVTSLSVSPNDVVNLMATGYLESVAAHGQDTCFAWSVQGTIGAIDANGTFTASAAAGGVGSITVSYGSRTATIPVTVGRLPEVVSDFEADITGFTGAEPAMTVSQETDLTRVRYGRNSLKMSYNFENLPTDTPAAELSANTALNGSPVMLSFWVYGDKSGHSLTAVFSDMAQMPVELTAGVIDFTGWRQITLQLPNGLVKLTGLRLVRAAGAQDKGTLWVDQITASYVAVPDVTPPVITLDSMDMMTQPGMLLLGFKALDSDGAALEASKLKLSIDGAQTVFSYDAMTGKLTAAVTAPQNGLHQITVEAVDASGNRSRFTQLQELPEAAVSPGVVPLADIEGHWSWKFVNYLDARGALTSRASGDGRRVFRPDEKLTRAEMAIFMTRVMKVDTNQYNNVQLPFTDLGEIPADAYSAVRAAYALGLIQGKSQYGGPLYFDPSGTVSRADFMTIVGRSLPKGYATEPLFFVDVIDVPAYSREYVELLVSLGIVEGNTDLTLTPLREVTRAEAAKMLFYFY